ncbi:MAG: bifunctional ornithine acetyltransferase/N-acetylglutamate synthase, partial [Candidatus Tectomicrobia bacterium]|nr:bifunctional ornithine acetyltransferase/N-acetylglutamate synthase [Candidatus Tectomicrobia bacterium]
MTNVPTLPFHPKGFLSVARNIGIKDETLDFTVIHSTARAVAVGMFTQSLFCGAPIIVGREHLADDHAHTLVVNSKNANVATGQRGVEDARATCRWVAQELGIAPEDVIPSSTGVIGHHLPMDRFQEAIAGQLDGQLSADSLDIAAEAIMTTDTRPKRIARRVGGAVVAGIAKGAGMIEPDMATMLAFVFTDAALSPAVLRPMLQKSVRKSFNMVSVDTDTSTSDTVIAMANGLAGAVDADAFQEALDEVCVHLAKEVARDGEG